MGGGALLDNSFQAVARFGKPRFLVPEAHLGRGWLEAFAVIWRRESSATSGSRFLGAALPRSPVRVSWRAVACSFVVHLLAFWLAGRLPVGRMFEDSQVGRSQQTVYEIQKLNLSAYLPTLRANGPGGRPGRGSRPDREPALGSTKWNPRWTLVSNPAVPDNKRQTIIQPNSPPELRIPFDLRLPDLAIGTAKTAPPPVPKLTPLAPRVVQRKSPQEEESPPMAGSTPEFAMKNPMVQNPSPKLPVPPPGLMGSLRPSDGRPTRSAQATSEASLPGDGAGLLSLSVDPGPLIGALALPPGNRYGAFSISPSGGPEGSPGGAVGGDPHGGTGSGESAGDESSGVGTGNRGGGGGGQPSANDLSVSASGLPGNASPTLVGAIGPGTIFPVVVPIRPRRNGLVVSTGPIGGGGLRVYGVLRGGRIHTVYLPMPGKNWVMQYCLREDAPSPQTEESRSVATRMGYNLVPPDAVEKFDFQRPSLPPEKKHEMIILHGILDEGGSIQDLRIHQGVHPDADQLALATFRRWKFSAAMRNGQAVGVEFLIGIPAAHSMGGVPAPSQ